MSQDDPKRHRSATTTPPTGGTVPDSRHPSTPNPNTLQDALGYGKRETKQRPTRSAHRYSPDNERLASDVPILRRMRPLERHAFGLGVPVTHLAVGSLSRTPPDALYEAMISDGRHPEGYPQANGQPALLDALATYLSNMTGLPIAPEDSCITRGGVDNITQVIMLTTEIGDTVTVFRPSWPNTPVKVRQLGRKCFSIHMSPDDGWRLTRELLAKIPRNTKLIVLERPGNPTAVGWTDEELELVREFMMDHDNRNMVFYADEEYFEIVDGMPRSILELGLSRTISGSAWSKNICATSIRLGRLTTLDRRLRQLFVPYWNVELGATNWMNVQHAIASILNNFGPKGLPAYVYNLNAEMAAKRDIAAEVFDGMEGARLIKGNGAIYDILVLDHPADRATQMLMWQFVEAIKFVESGSDGDVPQVPYAVPLSGFQDKWDGYDASSGTKRQLVHGFRVTYTINGQALRDALMNLRRMVESWRAAGRPKLGEIEHVIGLVKSGKTVPYDTKWCERLVA